MTTTNQDSARGLAFALAAYFLWGLLPVYMKALDHVSPAEVIAHRVIWSVPVAGVVLWLTGRTHDLRVALTSPNMLGMAVVTAALISVNWGIYVGPSRPAMHWTRRWDITSTRCSVFFWAEFFWASG